MKKLSVFLTSLLFISFVLTSCTKEKKEDPPIASFTSDKTSGNAPLTVTFTSTSTGNITSYSWSFGDGGTSTNQSPSHTYSSSGTYTASLTVTGPGGSNSNNKTITVTQAQAAPVAIFTSDNTSGNAPLTVNFTSTSTGTITSYSWSFGDGGTSTLQNPSHTYNSSGTFTATLTVTGPGGSNSSSKTITVISGTNITFNNTVFTKIYVTCNGSMQTITPGGSITYSSVPGTSVNYSAYTYGVTSTGTQVGLEMDWNATLTLTGGTLTVNLNIPSSYFFLEITNNSSSTWQGVYVNYGLTSQTYDNVVIYNTGVKIALGYYKAYTNSNVRVYSSNGLVQWNWYYGTNFTLPWTANQYVSLTGTKSSKNVVVDSLNMLSSQSFTNKKDPNALDLYCK
jgi:PKD repeat protein